MKAALVEHVWYAQLAEGRKVKTQEARRATEAQDGGQRLTKRHSRLDKLCREEQSKKAVRINTEQSGRESNGIR